MAALDNVSKQQFMPVSDLMNTYSHDALGAARHKVFNNGGDPKAVTYGEGTRMRDIYARKAANISGSERYQKLDDPIRSGTIDPVLLNKTDSGENEILEGHHRIARAHQLGVEKLPVTYDYTSQKHLMDWDEDYFGDV